MSEQKHPYVVVFPRGQLSAKDKERLTKGGVIAVEADTPDAVVQVKMAAPLSLDSSLVTGDLIVSALLKALATQSPNTDGGSITAVGRASHHFIRLLSEGVSPAKATGVPQP